MKIIRFSLGQLQANCYLLTEEEQCLIIDPADEASFILEEIQRRKLKLIGMLATHGHFDHVMAAGEIQLSIRVPLYIFREDLFLVKRLKETAKYFLGYEPYVVEPTIIKYLKEETFHVIRFAFRVLHTPGHTPGGCCIYFPEEKIVFTGDTLFKGAVGRYDFSYSDKLGLKKSLKRLLKLPKDTIVYPGHGEQTSMSGEKDFLHLHPI